MTVAFLDAFPADADALLARIAAQIDDAQLEEIARADYGWEATANLAALRVVRDRLDVEAVRQFQVREVLSLTQWSEPDYETPQGPPSGLRGHWTRAFATAALLRWAGEPDAAGHVYGINDTLIQLIASLNALGAPFAAEASAFLAWLIPQLEAQKEGDAELAFCGVGLLWFAVQPPPHAVEAVTALCEWIAARERAARTYRPSEGRWLIGPAVFGQRHEGWTDLGARLAACDLTALPADARDWVRLIGAALAGQND